MKTLTIFATVILLDLLSLIIPGQDFVLLSKSSMSEGKKVTLFMALGIAISQLILCLLGLIGILKIVEWNPSILPAIRTLGALYLIYLGSTILKNIFKNDEEDLQKIEKLNPKKSFLLGFISCSLNVESILFPLSLFTVIVPQDLSLDFKLLICLIVFLDTLIWYVLVIQLFSNKKFQNIFKKYQRNIELILGSILLFLGFKSLHQKN